MQTYRGEYYLKKDFGFIDLGIPAAVGMAAVGVYEVLRRFVWRSATTGNGVSRRAYSKGRLVSKISQTNIATYVGVSRKHVCKQIAILREIGWIETEGKDDEIIYVLGERVLDDTGGVHEVFYADALCRAVADHVRGDLEAQGKEKITEIPIGERIESVKTFFGVSRGPGGSVSVTKEGVSPMVTGGVTNGDSDPGGVSPMVTEKKRTLREREEREEETLEREPLRGVSQDGAPASFTDTRTLGEIEHSRSAPAENGNGDDTSKKAVPPSTWSKEERLQFVQRVKEEARAGSKAQKEANRKRDAAKARRIRNFDGNEVEKKDKEVKRFLEKAWISAYAEAFPEEEVGAWDGRIRGQTMQLVKLYDVGKVEAGLRYIALHWSTLRTRFKAKGKPSVGFLHRFHDALIPEAAQFASVFALKEEWDAWWHENPDEDPPEELEQRFRKHSKDMESLGLIG